MKSPVQIITKIFSIIRLHFLEFCFLNVPYVPFEAPGKAILAYYYKPSADAPRPRDAAKAWTPRAGPSGPWP